MEVKLGDGADVIEERDPKFEDLSRLTLPSRDWLSLSRGNTTEEAVRGRGTVLAGLIDDAANGEAAPEAPPIGDVAAEKLRGVEDLDCLLPPPSPDKRRAVAARKASFCSTSAMGDDGMRSEAIPGAELR